MPLAIIPSVPDLLGGVPLPPRSRRLRLLAPAAHATVPTMALDELEARLLRLKYLFVLLIDLGFGLAKVFLICALVGSLVFVELGLIVDSNQFLLLLDKGFLLVLSGLLKGF